MATRVALPYGTIEGEASDGVVAFRGIPYAAPPVGDLRWRAPQPVPPWDSVRPTKAFGPDPMQAPVATDAAPLGTEPDEDCLYLNVWRPADRRTGHSSPVVVWIYGGGFVNGGSSAPVYDGSAFARAGVVFVSFNYRIGRFGFFAHPALSAAGEGPLANYGFLDQLAALHWVRDHIARFGGDPERVTLMGESAGGISIMHLLTWPEAEGLFHRAVVMSGGGRRYLLGGRDLVEGSEGEGSAEATGLAFARRKGIEGSGPEALAQLRRLPASELVDGLNMATFPNHRRTYAGGPILDGAIAKTEIASHLQNGQFARVPLLIGTTSDDIPAELPPNPSNPLAFFGDRAPQAQGAYAMGGQALLAAVGADLGMHEPARFAATRWHEHGLPAWLYRFSYVAEALKENLAGAPHASEIPYFFRTLDARYPGQVSESDRQLAATAHRYVIQFIKTGDPNGRGLTDWPRFDPDEPELMNFSWDGRARYQPDPLQERLDLVEAARSNRSELNSNTER